MLKRLGKRMRLFLRRAAILIALIVTAALWWWLPAWPRARWQPEARNLAHIEFSQDGQTLLSCHEWGLALRDVPSGRVRARLSVDVREGKCIGNFHLSPNGRHLAVVVHSQPYGEPHIEPLLWSPDIGPLPRALPSRNFVGFTPDSEALIVSAGHLLNVDTATCTIKPLADPGVMRSLLEPRLLPDGRIVAIGSGATEGEELRAVTWADHGRGAMRSVRFRGDPEVVSEVSPDGRFFAGMVNHEVKVCVFDGGKEWATLSGGAAEAVFLPVSQGPSFSADGRFLITAHREFAPAVLNQTPVGIWDISGAPARLRLRRDNGGAAFSPDSAWVAVGRPLPQDNNWHWEIVPTSTFASHLDMGLLHGHPVFAPDSRTVVAPVLLEPQRSSMTDWLSWLGLLPPPPVAVSQLHIWDVPTGRRIGMLDDADTFTYFPDGRALAVCGRDGSIQVWDIPPRRPWWIDSGLPVVFALLVLLAGRLVWRAFRKPQPKEPAPC
jgi:WD40 repeat protein